MSAPTGTVIQPTNTRLKNGNNRRIWIRSSDSNICESSPCKYTKRDNKYQAKKCETEPARTPVTAPFQILTVFPPEVRKIQEASATPAPETVAVKTKTCAFLLMFIHSTMIAAQTNAPTAKTTVQSANCVITLAESLIFLYVISA